VVPDIEVVDKEGDCVVLLLGADERDDGAHEEEVGDVGIDEQESWTDATTAALQLDVKMVPVPDD
jgi:hypothetical protein